MKSSLVLAVVASLPVLNLCLAGRAAAGEGHVDAVSVTLSAIEADPAKLTSFCALMAELGKGAMVDGDGRAEQVGALISGLGPAFERGFDYEPASPEGIAFEDGIASLYERCDK